MGLAIQTQPSSNDSWKATAFLNVWAKRPDGSRLKIGAIAFKANKKADQAIVKRLSEEGGLEALLEVMEVDFNLVTDEPIDAGF